MQLLPWTAPAKSRFHDAPRGAQRALRPSLASVRHQLEPDAAHTCPYAGAATAQTEGPTRVQARLHVGLTLDPNASMQSVATPAAGSVPRRSRLPRLRLPLRHRDAPPEQDPSEMTLTGHLVELRHRLFIAAFSLVPGTIIGFILSGRIIHVLKAPLPTDKPLVALGLT